MKVVAFVPIKLNNERLPNKNILSFDNGNPLITYILDTLCSVKKIDEICVYCSNEEIRKYLPKKVRYLKRSESLDTSQTKINEVINAFIHDVNADVYILAHATAPFVKAESIEQGLEGVLKGDYDSAFPVKKIQDFLWKGGEPLNYDPADIPRTQDLEAFYAETSGFYIFHKELSLIHNRRIGMNPKLIEVDQIESIDIDDKDDFDIANCIYQFLLSNDRESV